jgi:hypothetical protein
VETFSNLNSFFQEVFEDLNCREDTKAYITSVFAKYKTSHFDFSKDSITLVYANAKQNSDFYTFQNIADWLFFARSFVPEHLSFASTEYYQSIGRLSYYSCYQLTRRQLSFYENLADDFVKLELETRKILTNQHSFVYI